MTTPSETRINDFAFMLQGEYQAPLFTKDIPLIQPTYLTRTPHKKRALLLIHGFTSTPLVYRELTPLIQHVDYISIPLLPGHGTTIEDFSTVQYTAWEAHIEAELNTLLNTFETVDVVGLSLGGLIAYQLAQRYPIHHLYLLAPAIYLKLPVPFLRIIIPLFMKLKWMTIKSMGGDIHAKGLSELTYRQIPLHALNEIFTYIETATHAPLTMPTSVFLGEFDSVVDNDKIQSLFSNQSTVTFYPLKKSAHVLPLDDDRLYIAKVISDGVS
jgi:carboxylesterase